MQRDFTYIDDIVDGVIRVLDNPPPPNEAGRPYRLYNIGNHRSEQLLRMIEILEQTIGRKAEKQLLPKQAGDVKDTYADISAIRRSEERRVGKEGVRMGRCRCCVVQTKKNK